MGRSGGGSSGGGHSGGFSGGGSSGGFSGGGRSGGFSGGGRSGGGRSGGFSGGGRSGGGAGRPGGGHYGGNNHHHHHYGGYYGGFGPRPPRPPRRRGFFGPSLGCGCGGFTFLMTGLIIICLLVAIMSASSGIVGGGITSSTVTREKLPAGTVQETGYYTDEAGWITNSRVLESGMKKFYQKTGVQPYLYILENDSVRSIAELQNIAVQKYDELFQDKAHMIIVFCDDSSLRSYHVGYHIGQSANLVMDSEALTILSDYMAHYYTSDVSEEEFFSLTFEKTADRMMDVTKPVWPYAAIAVCVLVAVWVIVRFLTKRQEQKAAEAKRAEEILKTPLEKFGDKEVEDLAKKYEKKE